MLNKIATITCVFGLLIMSEITYLHATPMIMEKTEIATAKAKEVSHEFKDLFSIASKIRKNRRKSHV